MQAGLLSSGHQAERQQAPHNGGGQQSAQFAPQTPCQHAQARLVGWRQVAHQQGRRVGRACGTAGSAAPRPGQGVGMPAHSGGLSSEALQGLCIVAKVRRAPAAAARLLAAGVPAPAGSGRARRGRLHVRAASASYRRCHAAPQCVGLPPAAAPPRPPCVRNAAAHAQRQRQPEGPPAGLPAELTAGFLTTPRCTMQHRRSVSESVKLCNDSVSACFQWWRAQRRRAQQRQRMRPSREHHAAALPM